MLALTEENADMQEVAEDYPKHTMTKMSSCVKFKWFFDQITLSPDSRKEATRAILGITEKYLEQSVEWEGPIWRLTKSMTSSITFSDEDKVVSHFHNWPLYVTAVVNGTEFPRTIFDGGASVNIMHLKSFKQVVIKENRLVKEPIYIFRFGNEAFRSLG